MLRRVRTGPLAIRLHGVVKRYGDITAVDHLDLEVPEGTCTGLLGPNGAGKSTTMRLLTAQAIADEGELEVLGLRLPEQSKIARAQCGVVPQLDNLDTMLTVEQNLRVFAHLYRVERGAAARGHRARARDREPGRPPRREGRQAQRRDAAAPADRPRAGAPAAAACCWTSRRSASIPQVRQELWALVDALRAEGTTILMSTHYIEEAERLADTVTIMSHGRGRRRRAAAGADRAPRRPAGGRGLRAARAAWRRSRPRRRAAGFSTRRTGTSISVLGVDGADGRAPEGERRPTNLEDVFVLLTGERSTDGHQSRAPAPLAWAAWSGRR